MSSTLRSSRFITGVFASGYILMINDFTWWMDNEREVLNWMVDNLPRGIEHQEGQVIVFDNDQDRLMFLMRWG